MRFEGNLPRWFLKKHQTIWMLSPRQHACATASTFFGYATAQVIYSCEPLRISITTFPNPRVDYKGSSEGVSMRLLVRCTPRGCFSLLGSTNPGTDLPPKSTPHGSRPASRIRVPSPRSAGHCELSKACALPQPSCTDTAQSAPSPAARSRYRAH